MAAAAREDELMSLPTDVLDIILARIPFDLLVRTCCLSRAWRRRWESVRYLDIRLGWGCRGAPSARDLWRCAAPVVGFRACVHARHFHHLPTWFPALASKGVRELAIECDGVRRGHPDTPPYWVIDQGLFSCAALAVLHLEDCDMPLAPPGFRGFPSLVSLTLRGVTLPAEGGGARVEHLVAAAPLLAELRLDDVDVEELEDPTPPLYKWAVRAPRLRVLKMATRLDIGCRIPEEPPLLEEAYIDIGNSFMSFHEIFRGIITVRKLWFNIHEVIT